MNSPINKFLQYLFNLIAQKMAMTITHLGSIFIVQQLVEITKIFIFVKIFDPYQSVIYLIYSNARMYVIKISFR